MIEFYATVDSDSIRSYMPDVPYLLPASSWARKNMKAPKLPEHVTRTAADCGGFVATFKWGEYRYTPAQYVDWLGTFSPRWAATMDYCCEDEITSGQPGIVRERQQLTTAAAYHFWHEYRATPWVWVPTVQGWTVADYQKHARELRPLVTEMQTHYGIDSAFRVGIGTLCRRASNTMIRDIVGAVSQELPGARFHLWGVKLGVIKNKVALQRVASVDSAAWDSQTGREDRKRVRGEWFGKMTQREWRYSIALPRYIQKFNDALNEPKQTQMEGLWNLS